MTSILNWEFTISQIYKAQIRNMSVEVINVKRRLNSPFITYAFMTIVFFTLITQVSLAAEGAPNQAVPVRVARVVEKMVSDQISLIGTAEAVAKSMVAAEVAGAVEYFPIREGDFIKKGELLVRLKSTYLGLRLKAALASRDSIQANLENAEKELNRLGELKRSKSIAETAYDNALYTYRALSKKLLQSEAEIDQLEYEIKHHEVVAPFSAFVAKEHTQVGEWINEGGPVATLLDLSEIRVTVDVPERYAVTLSVQNKVQVKINSMSDNLITGKISAILPQGDPTSRTFPVRTRLANPGYKIRAGMEAIVTFNLQDKKNALLVPKDAVVTAGNNRLVFMVFDGKVVPVNVQILGYYDGNVAIVGTIKKGDLVVTRGNERLMPGQSVQVIE